MTFNRIVVSWVGEGNATELQMAFGEGTVGFCSLFVGGGGWFGFLAKSKSETRGGEGPV